MKYTESHEWIDKEGRVGISEHAQHELGEIVYIELPKIGQEVTVGEEICVLESTKAASDVYAPVSGTIVEVNSDASKWLFKIKLSDPSELDDLLDEEKYRSLVTQ